MAIELIDTLTPKNSGSFPMVLGKDVDVDGKRLPELLDELEEMGGEPEAATSEDIDALFTA